MIVKNEERDIVSWLANAKAYADEMIVVDTGSTDKTRDLARRNGAKVFAIKWQDDFSKAKNYAIEQASGDWIAFLDADETFLQPELVREYLYRLEKDAAQLNVLMVPIINVDEDNQDAEQSRFLNVRLFRNHMGLCYRNPVHETLYAAGNQELCIREENHALHIRHTGYSSNRVHAKVMRNYRILQADIAANGEQEHHYRYLADCYYGFGKLEVALHYAMLAIKANLQAKGSASDMYDTAINCMEMLSYPIDEQLKMLTEARQRFPKKSSYQIKIGHCYFQQEKWTEAQKSLLSALEELSAGQVGNGDEYTGNEDKALLWQDLGQLYYRQHDIEGAGKCLNEARKLLPLDEGILTLFMQLIQDRSLSEQCGTMLEYFCQTTEQRNYLQQWLERHGYLQHYEMMSGNKDEIYAIAQREELMDLYKILEGKAVNNLSESCRILIVLAAQPENLLQAKQIIALKKMLPAELAAIWSCWERQENVPAERYSDFKLLGNYILEWGTNAQIADYCQLAGDFTPEECLEWAGLLQAQRKNDLAWQFYSAVPADSPAVNFDFWLQAGICQYEMDSYEVAAECFARAASLGCSGELEAYQAWNERRLKPHG
ncbi:tetratricopeptide repeat-containing glycosyltransferase family 2 protein [Selenomonas ruminantium]|uniref:tetratricopeptide repeat-containing glycosyltransferase family 2 protein n=1 Tax=Selenomonas ruminantium TaxID=971 RepID=UPI0015A65394|nr:glycosyltransferase family 2 protein [Selenomonas ruminantium]